MGRPFVILQLDKPRRLRFGINALIVVEELTGKSITEFNFNSMSMKDIRAIIYAGLAGEDDTLNPKIVADLIDEYSSISEVSEALGKAMDNTFGKEVEGKAVEGKAIETETKNA